MEFIVNIRHFTPDYYLFIALSAYPSPGALQYLMSMRHLQQSSVHYIGKGRDPGNT
jgi:hypothetical protein